MHPARRFVVVLQSRRQGACWTRIAVNVTAMYTSSRWSEVYVVIPSRGLVEHDLAILAFVKCHLTSFLRWDLLCLLARFETRWIDALEAAHELHKPLSAVQAELAELRREELVEAQPSPNGAMAYRLDPQEPSTRVIERLVHAATRSQELRRIIVARLVEVTKLAS